jgi:hypothetical protein
VSAAGRKPTLWKAGWCGSAELRRAALWRGVEAQHVAATMKLVDSADEQATLETACTELAYWGWRFLMDSDGLRDGELITEFTLFPAKVEGVSIDLGVEPWDTLRPRWAADDYADCHALADAARERGIEWLRYPSARHVKGHCGAVFVPTALKKIELARQQTWRRKITRRAAFMVHGDQAVSLEFDPEPQARPSSRRGKA